MVSKAESGSLSIAVFNQQLPANIELPNDEQTLAEYAGKNFVRLDLRPSGTGTIYNSLSSPEKPEERELWKNLLEEYVLEHPNDPNTRFYRFMLKTDLLTASELQLEMDIIGNNEYTPNDMREIYPDGYVPTHLPNILEFREKVGRKLTEEDSPHAALFKPEFIDNLLIRFADKRRRQQVEKLIARRRGLPSFFRDFLPRVAYAPGVDGQPGDLFIEQADTTLAKSMYVEANAVDRKTIVNQNMPQRLRVDVADKLLVGLLAMAEAKVRMPDIKPANIGLNLDAAGNLEQLFFIDINEWLFYGDDGDDKGSWELLKHVASLYNSANVKPEYAEPNNFQREAWTALTVITELFTGERLEIVVRSEADFPAMQARLNEILTKASQQQPAGLEKNFYESLRKLANHLAQKTLLTNFGEKSLRGFLQKIRVFIGELKFQGFMSKRDGRREQVKVATATQIAPYVDTMPELIEIEVEPVLDTGATQRN